MKPAKSLLVFAVSAVLQATPAATLAQDTLEDLEVTMEVVDDARELEQAIAEMRGPDEEIVEYDDRIDGPGATPELMGSEGGLGGQSADLGLEAVPLEDNFEEDELARGNYEILESDQAFQDEVDFEEDEHVDQDEYDELDDLYDDAEEMDDEPSVET